MLTATALFCFTTAIGTYAQAQIASAQREHLEQSSFKGFDVISVKQHRGEESGMSVRASPDTLAFRNVTVVELLMNAFDMRNDHIYGVPSWASKLRWDVTAKLLDKPVVGINHPPLQQQDSGSDQVEMQSVLLERFGLRAHIEQRILPVFNMVAVKSGVKFHVSTAPVEKHGHWLRKPEQITAIGVTLGSLAEMITYEAGRTIIDKTGLHGDYDMSLSWSSEEQIENARDSAVTGRPPVIFTALREQLGLNLVPAKGPVKTLVVDAVQVPKEN